MDVGSAENAWSNFQPAIHGHNRTAIPGSLRYTTTTEGGSVDIAGANIHPSIHGHKKAPLSARLFDIKSFLCIHTGSSVIYTL